MGKARLLLSILLFTAFLFSLISSEPFRNDSTKANSNSIYYYIESYESHTKFIVPAEHQLASKMWIDMKKHPKAVTLSRRQMSEGKATIYPADMPVGERNTLVEVLTNGGIKLVRRNSEAYASPLLAKFDTSCSSSKITYLATDDFLAVQWHDMRLDHPIFSKGFTFQATFYSKDKTFLFVYEIIPYDLKIVSEQFDGYPGVFGAAGSVMNQDGSCTLGFDMDVNKYEIKSGAVISVKGHSYCKSIANCKHCAGNVNHVTPFPLFFCAWCPTTDTCTVDTEIVRKKYGNGKFLTEPKGCPIDLDDLKKFNKLSMKGKLNLLLKTIIIPVTFICVLIHVVIYLYSTFH